MVAPNIFYPSYPNFTLILQNLFSHLCLPSFMPSSISSLAVHILIPFWKLLLLNEGVGKFKEIKFNLANVYWLLNYFCVRHLECDLRKQNVLYSLWNFPKINVIGYWAVFNNKPLEEPVRISDSISYNLFVNLFVKLYECFVFLI